MRSNIEIDSMAVSFRRELGEDSLSPIDIFSLARTMENLTLVLYPMGKNISGICIKGSKSNLIAINSQMSIGRQRFTLAHEFYHLRYDASMTQNVCFLNLEKADEIEAEADAFASHFLLPSAALYDVIRGCDSVTIHQVVWLEQRFGLSRQAMLYRLKADGKINSAQYTAMQSGVQASARKLGYDTALYLPTPIDHNMTTVGHYIRVADTLLENDTISVGKYEELLLDAFREDIVFGDDETGAEEENVD